MKILFVGNTKSVLSVERFNLLSTLECIDHIEFIDSIKEKNTFIRLIKYINLFVKMYLKIKMNKVNVVIYHGTYHFLLNLLYIKPIKIIAIPQGSEINEEYSGRVKFFIDILFNHSDYVFARSKAMQKRLIHSLNVAENKTLLFNWGINDCFFASDTTQLNDKITIISYRATGKIYNIDLIFDAIDYLKRKYKNLHFIYVRHNKDIDLKLDMDIVDEYYVDLSYPELASIVRRSDISVSIPTYDGFATSIVEALASGAYPIISDIEAYSNVFPDERWLMGKTKPIFEDLCITLEQCIQNITYVNEHKEQRRSYALSNYSRASQLRILADVLEDLKQGNR